MSELRLRKDRNRFHFYFGDSLELCLMNEELHNKMHVIHCSADIGVEAELANILPAVSRCLISDIPEAIIVTESIFSRFEGRKPTLVEYVEFHLNCPLTMIPTMYGVRLFDHFHLGSSVCCQLHDDFNTATPITLKWHKTPVAYSADIQMEISPAIEKVVRVLAKHCFFPSQAFYYSKKRNIDGYRTIYLRSQVTFNHSTKHKLHVVRYTPLTFYNIMQSLVNRLNWAEGAIDALLQKCAPASYQLAWKTLKTWMKGDQVLLFYNNNSEMRDAILKNQTTELICVQFILKEVGTRSHYRLDQTVNKDFFLNTHQVLNLNWKDSNADVDTFAVSFLLSKDHALNSATHLFIIDPGHKTLLYSIKLMAKSMHRELVTNLSPRRFAPPSAQSNLHRIVRCQESEEEYKILVDLRRIKLTRSAGTDQKFRL